MYWSILPEIYILLFSNINSHPTLYSVISKTGIYAILIFCIYNFNAYKNITKYQELIINNLSTIDKIQLNWVKQSIVVLFLTFLLVFIFLFIVLWGNSFKVSEAGYLNIVPITFSILIYWLSIKGYSQSQTMVMFDESTITLSKNDDYSIISKQLIGSMEGEKLYQDSSLNLRSLSAQTQLSEREISNALNHYLGKNFYTFVNEYRVEEAKERLSDINNNHLSIISIAYDSGFNSKATFNRIFKSLTGNPPNFYRPKA